ncbi:MAG: cupin domain-containing protein [Halanaerobium sp.]|nr:cupin domain-containing protein [Halanaerobium sp.]
MKLIRMDEIEGKVNKRGIQAKELLNHQHARVMNLILQPGDSIPPHSVPVDVFFYVVAGKGTIKVGGQEQQVQPKDIVTCPPGTEMSVKADQGDEFIVLNVKTPSL